MRLSLVIGLKILFLERVMITREEVWIEWVW